MKKTLACFVLVFGTFSVMHAIHHEWGETFGTAIAALVPLAMLLHFAFADPEETKVRFRPEAFQRAKEEALKHSFLNWNNIPPNKRNPPPGMIG